MKKLMISTVRRLALLLSLILILVGNALAQPPDHPWPMYRYNAQGSAKSPYAGPEEPFLKWPDPGFSMFYLAGAPPTIARDGTIYVTQLSGADHPGHLYAINPDGTQKWVVDLTTTGANSPPKPALAADGTVYIIDHGENRLLALDPDNGRRKWQSDELGPYSFGVAVIGDDGTIYTSAGSTLYAFDPTNGRTRWQTSEEGFSSPFLVLSPDSGTLYLKSGGWDMFAVDTTTHRLKWRAGEFKNVPENAAVGPDGTIYASIRHDSNHLVALAPSTGEQRWRWNIENFYPGSLPAVDGDTIYVASDYMPSDEYGMLYAIIDQGASASEKWTFRIPGGFFEGFGRHPIVGGDGAVYVVSDAGVLYAVDPDTGREKWQFDETAQGHVLQTQPAIGQDGAIYIGHSRGLFAIGGEKPAPTAAPAAAEVTNCIRFNTGKWTDLSPVFTRGNEIFGFTDNKYSGTGYMYLWLSFDSPSRISLRPSPDEIDPLDPPNWGDRAELQVEEVSSSELPRRLSADNVPSELGAGLRGPYIYRLTVTAPDQGYHSSYIFSFDSPANYALGKGKVDVPEAEGRSRVRVCNIGAPSAPVPTPTPDWRTSETGGEGEIPAQAGTLSGKIALGGSADHSGVTVSINGQSVTTARDGSFTITDIPPGTYTVSVSKPGYEAVEKVEVVVTGGETNSLPEMTLVSEATPSGMTLQAGQRRVEEDGAVTVPVWLINGANVANINFSVAYDAGVATPEGDLIKGNLLDNALFSSNPAESGLIQVGFAQTSGVNGTGTVAYIPFRAVGQPGDRTPLQLAVTTINNPAGTVLDIDRINGEILIVGPDGVVPGDCDGDGVLNALDALCALQMSVDLIPERLALDLDADSQVTSRDSVIILQRAIGK